MPSRAKPSVVRYAAVDIGTNTVLGLMAQASVDNATPSLETLDDLAFIVRLGEGLNQSPQFKPQAMERALSALERCHQRMEELKIPAQNRVVMGTAGLRRAQNAQALIEKARTRFGFEIQVIDGEQEAYLSFLAVVVGLRDQLKAFSDVWIMDIGGGSTEIVFGANRIDARPRQAVSLPLGSVWLTEQFLADDDPPRRENLRKACDHIDEVLAQSGLDWTAKGPLVGIAGTVTTLAAIAREMETYDAQAVHGSRIARGEFDQILKTLARLPLKERKSLPGLQAERADVIVAGALIAQGVMRKTHASDLWVSDQGLRYGALYDLIFDPS